MFAETFASRLCVLDSPPLEGWGGCTITGATGFMCLIKQPNHKLWNVGFNFRFFLSVNFFCLKQRMHLLILWDVY